MPTLKKLEQPPIPYEVKAEMQDRLTDALRALADALDLAHDVDEVETAAMPTIHWWRAEHESGLVNLKVEAEVLIQPRTQRDDEGSHIMYLKLMEREEE